MLSLINYAGYEGSDQCKKKYIFHKRGLCIMSEMCPPLYTA